MNKKSVLNAGRIPLNIMVKQLYTNSGSSVYNVIGRLYGKRSTTVWHGVNIGSGCGLWKTVRSDSCANSRATVHLSSMESRITGLNRSPRRNVITLRCGM